MPTRFSKKKIERDSIPIQDQHLDISSDESIIPSMSASNCSIATIKTNHFFSPPLPVDINESNNLLLEAIIEGGASFFFQKSIYQFICKSNWISIATDGWTNIRQDNIINFMAIGKSRQIELVRIKDTFGESQNSMVIFRDLENTVIQIESQHATLADVVYLYANNLTDWLILMIFEGNWHMAQKENISLKQKEIENLCQIVQQDIIMPNFNEVSREQVPLLTFYLLIVKQVIRKQIMLIKMRFVFSKFGRTENSENPEEAIMKTIDNIDIQY
ncbi:hypothetical protein F8M41_002221 [Gigaspora margarita]|uniref:DUF659 domain-containing protein n=1 Tax=Gigaspora margarita TaxID=4874 RepID=A0A8H3XDX1_GIGMA|nr:hypothetical protein F8M41_002221 [Gigaspora margarita]